MCKRRMISLLLVMVMFCSVYCCGGAVCQTTSTAKAKAKSFAVQDDSDQGGVRLGVVTGDGDISMSLSSVGYLGHVVGYGVRLRKAPSLTSTVLGLMNKGEVVVIYLKESEVGKGFYYVKRVKTGMKGYASTEYIVI